MSFDTPAENKSFKEKFDFPFHLLSDVDRSVGTQYGADRPTDDPYASFARRISYLVDPSGTIRRGYEVDDPAGHAAVVLADLNQLTAT